MVSMSKKQAVDNGRWNRGIQFWLLTLIRQSNIALLSTIVFSVITVAGTWSILREARMMTTTSELPVVSSSLRATRNSSLATIETEISLPVTTGHSAIPTPNFVTSNASQVKLRRQQLIDHCSKATSAAQVDALRGQTVSNIDVSTQTMITGAAAALRPTDQLTQNDERSVAIKPCKHVLLDFGANIGDTSAKFMDAGAVGCDRKSDLGARISAPHYDLHLQRWVNDDDNDGDNRRRAARHQNPFTVEFMRLIQSIGPTMGPEDYCYYGVEGNPVFTDRLQKHADFIMSIRPHSRPIQHLHFFTESVGAGRDGRTRLYLDTVNTDENFWGSSLFPDHRDVQRSTKAAGGKPQFADVMGYTLGTLLRMTTLALHPNATTDDKSGGHLIVKVDIEGGEYELLNEAAAEGTLCEFVKMGNQADLYIEYHSPGLTGPNEIRLTQIRSRRTLEACGVNFLKFNAMALV